MNLQWGDRFEQIPARGSGAGSQDRGLGGGAQLTTGFGPEDSARKIRIDARSAYEVPPAAGRSRSSRARFVARPPP